ncbi:hypothetical protein D3C85_1359100 [compost metagenome]
MTNSPATTKVSLLARPMSLPASIAAIVGFKPTEPITAVKTKWVCGNCTAAINPSSPAITFVFGKADLTCWYKFSLPITTNAGLNSKACAISKSALCRAVKASTLYKSGFARTTSSACVPIEPVEPNMDMCFKYFSFYTYRSSFRP